MIQRRTLCLTLALGLLLGCGGSGDTKAQEKPGPDAKADEKGDAKPPAGKGDAKPGEAKGDAKPGDAKPAEDAVLYRATVTDRSTDVKEYAIQNAVIWVPEVSILGGEGHTVEKRLLVKKGATEITVPFADIAWIDVGALKEDRLEVKVKTLAVLKREQAQPAESRKNEFLVGSVKSNLQLAGRYDDTAFAAHLKIRGVVKIVLEPMPAEPGKPDAPK